mmetsp:Transcript_29674/g.58786  ORF Transcript_29674/g.58786 Transcript_29674/m.58786 type:complete len:364 (+) Transcript_29674:3150-4241(+)
MDEAGLHVLVDPAANLIGSRPGERDGRRLVIGSHLDTKVKGGRLDGTYGVLAAIEVADALRCLSSPLRHGLAVVAFSSEECVGGTAGMFGSRAVVGEVDAAELDHVDTEGVSVRARLRAAGGAPERLREARWEFGKIRAFVEPHIEGGPRLDGEGCTLGVAGGIVGRQLVDLAVQGISSHAGTCPMGKRKDALCAAADLILVIEGLGGGALVDVATIGRLTVLPNVTNVVPGSVEIGAEFRSTEAEAFDVARIHLEEAVEQVARQRAVRCKLSWKQTLVPTACDTTIVDAVRRVAASSGHAWVEGWSGPGHAAQVLAPHLPIGMLLVPTDRDHTERIRSEDLVAGAQTLYHTLLELDRPGGVH